MIIRPFLAAASPVVLLLLAQFPGPAYSCTQSDCRDRTGLDAALEQIRQQRGAFDLRVDCTGDKGARNLRMFPDGVAHWDGRLEFMLEPEERARLAGILLEQDFSSLAPEYGGRSSPESGEAPLRISCSVGVHLDGVSHRSQQFVDGYQSPKLKALADALLDQVAPLAERRGVGAESLADGLARVARGQLSEHAFRLRLLVLSRAGGGSIFEIADGRARIQPYAPGSRIGKPAMVPVDNATLSSMIGALRTADIGALPLNLYSDNHVELRVAVMNRDHTVLARRFTRLRGESESGAARRFNRLVGQLSEVRDRLAASGSRQ